MKQLTLNIKDNSKIAFFMELIRSFDFIEVQSSVDTKYKKEFVQDLKEALNDVKLHQAGKKKLKSAKELLDEL